MIFFPQLETGAAGQFPVRRRGVSRTVVNRAADGSEVKLEDPGAARVEWTVTSAELTAAEWDAISSMLAEVEGSLATFTFLDPLDNLLEQSQAFEASAWTRDPFIALVGGIADPLSGTGGTQVTNSGLAVQRISQPIDGHGAFQYCFSVWARSPLATEVKLFRSADGAVAETGVTAIGNWRRISSSGKLVSIGESMTVGIEFPAGSTVEIFGAQLEAQLGASAYKRTLGQAGVYTEARFSEDRVIVTATGLSQFGTTLKITARR